MAGYNFSFVLKTDDDSFVNVPALVADLRSRCTAPSCHNERLYMGYQVGRGDSLRMLSVLRPQFASSREVLIIRSLE